MGYFRKFNGKRFSQATKHRKKSTANRWAQMYQDNGYRTRIVKTKYGYRIWIREKK